MVEVVPSLSSGWDDIVFTAEVDLVGMRIPPLPLWLLLLLLLGVRCFGDGRTNVTLGFVVVLVLVVLPRGVVVVFVGTMSSTTTEEEVCVATDDDKVVVVLIIEREAPSPSVLRRSRPIDDRGKRSNPNTLNNLENINRKITQTKQTKIEKYIYN